MYVRDEEKIDELLIKYVDDIFKGKASQDEIKIKILDFLSYLNERNIQLSANLVEGLCRESTNFSNAIDNYFTEVANGGKQGIEKGFKTIRRGFKKFCFEEKDDARIVPVLKYRSPSKRISEQEMLSLLKRYRNDDKQALKELIMSNVGLITLVCKKNRAIQRLIAENNIDKADVFQEGVIGLMSAFKKYDETSGYKFSTYAYSVLETEMFRALNKSANQIKIPEALRIESYIVEDYINDFYEKYETYPKVGEISAGTGICEKDIKRIITSTITDRIDDPLNNVEQEYDFEDDMLKEMSNEALLGNLSKVLTDGERDFIYSRMGVEEEPRKLTDIAKSLKVSPQRASEKEKTILRKIKAMPYIEEFSYLCEKPSEFVEDVASFKKKSCKERKKELLKFRSK